jgi:3-oxoadipate enol-lactonase
MAGVRQETSVLVDACEISYDAIGEGAAIVLIHGLGGSKALWSDLGDRFGPGYRVVALDLRGAGRTRERTPSGLSLTRWSDDLRALLEELDADQPVLIGHSLGASIALKYALRWPDDVRALVLMGADANLSHLAPRMRGAAELIERLGLPAWVDNHWSSNTPFSAASLRREPEILDRYRAMLLGNDDGNYIRTCLAVATSEDLTDRLGDVTQPALVIVGADDDRTLPEHGRELARRLGCGTLVELPDVGHTLPLEAPGEIAAAVQEFLGEVAPPAPPGGRLDGGET